MPRQVCSCLHVHVVMLPVLCRFVLARDNDMEMGPLQEQPQSPVPVRPPKPTLASLAERPHPPPQGYRPQPDPWRVGAQI